jgi:hypothetical protein
MHSDHRVAALVTIGAILLGFTAWRIVGAGDDSGAEQGAEQAAVHGTAPNDAPSGGARSPLTAQVDVDSVGAMESVALSGHLDGGQAGARLQVQQLRAGRWVTFPLRPVVDESGSFRTYVELGDRGEHQLRVVEPASGATSKVLVVRVD